VSRPGRGVVNEETCPIVRSRGCSAGFIGTGFLSAAPPKFPAGPIRSRPWRLGPQPGAYKDGAHFVNRHSLACSRSVNIVLLVTNFILSF
jgi:hypothetical protein